MGVLTPGPSLPGWVEELRLVDQHCHSVLADDPDATRFGSLLTEAAVPVDGLDPFDSTLGLSVRRWCAPVLGLPPHAPPADYLARRAELGGAEATRSLLRAAGAATLLVDTGLGPGQLLGLDGLAAACAAPVREVLRLEPLAEQVADSGVSAVRYAGAVTDEVARRAKQAVAVKSILAYRHGLDVDPSRPGSAEVRAAASRWLRFRPAARMSDPVLLRHLLWCGLDTGLPLQLHTGLGDPDEDLHRSNPVLLTELCRRTLGAGTPLVLLHCYPYHREAAWLAHVFAHVHVDIGLASTFVGARATAVLAELLELAPFGKVLYSSDGYGLAEMHYLGALRFRQAMHAVLGGWQRAGEAAEADVRRVAGMIAGDNAHRLYRLA